MADTMNPGVGTPESTAATVAASIQSATETPGIQSVATGDAVAPATTTAGSTEVVGTQQAAPPGEAAEPAVDPLDAEQMGQAVLKDLGVEMSAEVPANPAAEVVQQLAGRIDGLTKAFMDTRQELAGYRRLLVKKEQDPFAEPSASEASTTAPAQAPAFQRSGDYEAVITEVGTLRNEMEWNEVVRRHPILATDAAPNVSFKKLVAGIHRGTPGISVAQAANMVLQMYGAAVKRGSAASVSRIKSIVETGSGAAASKARTTSAAGARAAAAPAPVVTASSEGQTTYEKALGIVTDVLNKESAESG